MDLRPEEISGIIKEQIKHYRNKMELSDVGTVMTVGDGIANINGIEKCMSGELLELWEWLLTLNRHLSVQLCLVQTLI